MARLPRLCLPNIPQHIIQRGNNRDVCFAAEEDYAAYAYWLKKYSKKYEVAIHAWVFMTNHVHLLATPQTVDGISKLMQALGRQYVRYFNYTYKRTGTLWEGRFKSCIVDADNYLLICQRYIELNPVRAGMVEAPSEYKWSSYNANGLGQAITLYQPHPVYCALGKTPSERSVVYRSLFKGQLEMALVNKIRLSTQKGFVLGSDKFKQQVEALTGRRVSSLRPGPKPKKKESEFLL